MKPFKFNSPAEIVDKLSSVETQSSPSFDGQILAVIMEMIIKYGFKLEDFGELTIKDVVGRKGELQWPFDTVRPNPLDDFIELIQSHLAHLKDKGYSVNKKAPLFPQLKQNGSKQHSSGYHPRELRRDLKEFAGTTWEQLRRDGIHHHYQVFKQQGQSDQEIVGHLANQFREDWNKIFDILKIGRIALHGLKREPVAKAQPTEPSPAQPQTKKRASRKISKSPIQNALEIKDGSNRVQASREPSSGGTEERGHKGSSIRTFDLSKIENKNFLKFEDDELEDDDTDPYEDEN